MPYGKIVAYRNGSRITVHIDLPDCGELSQRGRADNFTDPTEWCTAENDDEELQIKVVVCRPHRRRHHPLSGSRRMSYAALA